MIAPLFILLASKANFKFLLVIVYCFLEATVYWMDHYQLLSVATRIAHVLLWFTTPRAEA